jgi:Ase1/PRC1/MAP65 family protein
MNAPASQIRSPSKIPARVPLGNLQHGSNSPERKVPAPGQNHVQQNHAHLAKSMGPPRVPPPKMRDLFAQSSNPSTSAPFVNAPPPRPASVMSSTDSNGSGKFVRPISPEDVYDDRERMSYMSASLLQRDREHCYQTATPDFNSSMQRYAPISMAASQAPSRQTSNTSNLTSGTTASSSENWESYSDNGSELEPERDAQGGYYAKAQVVNGKRLAGGYAQMAPPPKMRMHNRVDGGDENARAVRVEGSDAAWSTEASETY